MKKTIIAGLACVLVASPFLAAPFSGGPASATPRNGTGFNKQFLGTAGPPVVGRLSWGFRVTPTCTITGTWLLRVHASPSPPIMTAAGELLINLSSPQYFQRMGQVVLIGGTVFVHLPIPNDASLCGVTASAQAISLCVGTGAPPDLSNAVDLVLGS